MIFEGFKVKFPEIMLYSSQPFVTLVLRDPTKLLVPFINRLNVMFLWSFSLRTKNSLYYLNHYDEVFFYFETKLSQLICVYFIWTCEQLMQHFLSYFMFILKIEAIKHKIQLKSPYKDQLVEEGWLFKRKLTVFRCIFLHYFFFLYLNPSWRFPPLPHREISWTNLSWLSSRR